MLKTPKTRDYVGDMVGLPYTLNMHPPDICNHLGPYTRPWPHRTEPRDTLGAHRPTLS